MREMIMLKSIVLFVVACLSVTCASVFAEDMREAAVKANSELMESLTRKKENSQARKKEKNQIIKEIQVAKTKLKKLNQNITSIQKQIAFLTGENIKLEEEYSSQQSDINELSGAVRVAAGDLKVILTNSMYTARASGRLEKFAPVLDTKRFPGIDDMQAMANLYFEETRLTGGIDIQDMDFISKTGENVSGTVLTLGGFTAAYKLANQIGFLNYSSENSTLFALPVDPSYIMQKALTNYMNGNADSVYIDISRGEALRQITHRQTLTEQIQQGGIIVWPILGLGLIAIFIGLERVVYLRGVHTNTDIVMGRVNNLAAEGEWEQCDKVVGTKKIPVYNVLRSGLDARFETRETLESILQESILKELPKLERFLPMLNIMGAISPLLGLLGTVTGMISTFHVITLYGTGDPRMMSGGISTALVTTMVGLGVAIPIMLLYTFLTRKVEHVIGDMEEKAVALTNIIFREVKECTPCP